MKKIYKRKRTSYKFLQKNLQKKKLTPVVDSKSLWKIIIKIKI